MRLCAFVRIVDDKSQPTVEESIILMTDDDVIPCRTLLDNKTNANTVYFFVTTFIMYIKCVAG